MLKFIIAAVFLGWILWFMYINFDDAFGRNGDPGKNACSLEAKLCSDGTVVVRTGPNCEFSACPGE